VEKESRLAYKRLWTKYVGIFIYDFTFYTSNQTISLIFVLSFLKYCILGTWIKKKEKAKSKKMRNTNAARSRRTNDGERKSTCSIASSDASDDDDCEEEVEMMGGLHHMAPTMSLANCAPPPPAAAARVMMVRGAHRGGEGGGGSGRSGGETKSNGGGGETNSNGATIQVKGWDPKTPYITKLKARMDVLKCSKVTTDEVLSGMSKEYAAQRNEYRSSPSFYFDCGSYFFNLLKENTNDNIWQTSFRSLAINTVTSVSCDFCKLTQIVIFFSSVSFFYTFFLFFCFLFSFCRYLNLA
jgi:hypothetical protein